MNITTETLGARRLGWRASVLGAALLCLLPPAAPAFVLEGSHWPDNQAIVMDLQLGSPGRVLIDGSNTWDQVAQAALDTWNPYLGGGVQFKGVETAAAPAQGDGRNSVFFSKTIYGETFGADTLAVTLISSDHSTGIATEADVLFNSIQPYDSYRGALRAGGAGGTLYDLRRVAIHEFGHVLGLDHVPQNTVAIMTPVVTNIDTVQADDVAGVQSIYGVPPPVQPVLTVPASVDAQVGHSFSFQIVASGPPSGYQADNLPPGLSLNALTGLISGVPTTGGVFNVAVSASNRAGTTSAILTITVAAPPAITSTLAVTAKLDQPFSYQITATNLPVSYAVTGVPIPYSINFGPGLPASLSVDPNTGLISGFPTVPGTFSLVLNATNSAGTGQAILVLKIVLTDDSLATLHTFTETEGYPTSPLVQATDGNFYGTLGSSFNDGSIYRMSPDGALTILHTFASSYDPATHQVLAPDGVLPSGLLQAADGNFCGVTTFGGNSNRGTVFRCTPKGELTTLHTFSGAEGGQSSPLTQGADGSLYGITRSTFDGYNSVSLFKLAPDSTFTTLHLFNTQGFVIVTPLMQAEDGGLYGVIRDNNNPNGTVFRCAPDGTYTVLHQFQGADGKWPAGLMQAKDGDLYGTTSGGGANDGSTIFKLTLDGALTTLHSFSFVEGTGPSRLIQASDGDFYGTAAGGGDNGGAPTNGPLIPTGNGKGTLFALTPDGRFTTLYIFGGTNGASPGGSLTQASDGYLYGTTTQGYTTGTVFRKGLVPIPDAQPPTVSAASTTPEIVVGRGGVGLINLTLTNAPGTDLTVQYTLAGDAANGTDYAALKGTVKFKAGRTSKTIKITPLWNLNGATKKVKFKLSAGDGYVLGTAQTLKIKMIGY